MTETKEATHGMDESEYWRAIGQGQGAIKALEERAARNESLHESDMREIRSVLSGQDAKLDILTTLANEATGARAWQKTMLTFIAAMVGIGGLGLATVEFFFPHIPRL